MTDGVRVGLIILAVSDLPRAVTFYQQAFGWRQIVDVPVYAELVQSDGLRIGLYERHAYSLNTTLTPGEVPAGGITATELYLYTDAPESLIKRLDSLGAPQLSPLQIRSWEEEVTYYADPDGNVLAIARAATG